MVIIYQYVKYSLVIRKVSQNRLLLILFSQGRIQCWAGVLPIPHPHQPKDISATKKEDEQENEEEE